MTIQERNSRDQRTIHSIQTVFSASERLRQYAASIRITIENATVVLWGELPSVDLKSELVPAVRRAGVLSQICDRVAVTTR